jgi:muconolactone delta-isomerase
MVAMQSKRAKQIRREEGQVWNRLQGEGKLKKDQLQSRTEVYHLLRVVGETSVKHLFL